MQVSFTGILKAYLSSENSVQKPIEKKFLKAKRVEDVFNRQDDFRTYTVSEQMKMLFSAKKQLKITKSQILQWAKIIWKKRECTV